MIGRRVRPAMESVSGVVVQYEPLSAGMTDVLVRFDGGRECWYASRDLRPVDGVGPLPDRRDALARARGEALTSLRKIRADLVAGLRKPWPGAEHGKAILGRAIDAAIEDLES